MRGVVSAGMVTALHYLGLRDCFDVVYGSSAGSINGAYFLSKQPEFGVTIYYEDINNSKFISLNRMFSSTPIMNLDYLLDNVMLKSKPLDCESIMQSSVPLTVIVSSLSQMKSVPLRAFQNRNEILNALRASSTMPLIAGKPVNINSNLYYDASIFEPIPFSTAIKDGCTHLLVLLSRPKGVLRGKPSFVDKYIIGPKLTSFHKDLMHTYLDRSTKYAQDIAWLQNQTEIPTVSPFTYAVQVPIGTKTVSRMETDRERLILGATVAMQSLIRSITGHPAFKVTQVLKPYGSLGHVVNLEGVSRNANI